MKPTLIPPKNLRFCMRLAVTLMQILAQFGRPKPAENGHLKPVQIFQKISKKSQN